MPSSYEMMTGKARAQSAMEYLMTYGWAILIIAVVLGALFQLGVFNSSSFSPRAPPGACQVFRPNGPGTTTNINLMGVCTGQLPQYVGAFNGQNYYVDLGSSSKFLTGSFTVAIWVKPGNKNWHYLISNDAYNVLGAFDLVQRQDSSNGYVLYYDTSGGQPVSLTSSYGGSSNNRTWSQVAVTYDTATLSIYVNGVFKGSVARGGSFLTANSMVTSVEAVGGGRYFNGTMANVQIYSNVLSANEIQALYLEGIGGAPVTPQYIVGWWPLNGDTKDYSGNNNNGVSYNGVAFTSQYGK